MNIVAWICCPLLNLFSRERTPDQVCVFAGRTAALLGLAQFVNASCSTTDNQGVGGTSSLIKA